MDNIISSQLMIYEWYHKKNDEVENFLHVINRYIVFKLSELVRKCSFATCCKIFTSGVLMDINYKRIACINRKNDLEVCLTPSIVVDFKCLEV